MTKEQFLEKVKELVDDGFTDWIMATAQKAVSSGALNLDGHEDNYRLPKIFISAMGEEIKAQYAPTTPKEIRERNNLANFL